MVTNNELDDWIRCFQSNVETCAVELDGLDCLELVEMLAELKEKRRRLEWYEFSPENEA